MQTALRINLWSGPRNISTAMMYSFAQRSDTLVVDEPLYAHYLQRTGLDHPGLEEILQSQEHDGRKVVEQMIQHDFGKPIVFFKQMTHHLRDLPLDFLSRTKNIVLIRDPGKVLISYSKIIENPTLSDIGIEQSYELFQFLNSHKYHCIVIDSDEVLKNPEAMLTKICDSLGIGFQKEMLHWKAGARKEDGVWARHWYKNVHQSTGFAPFKESESELNGKLTAIFQEARKFYDRLLQESLKV